MGWVDSLWKWDFIFRQPGSWLQRMFMGESLLFFEV